MKKYFKTAALGVALSLTINAQAIDYHYFVKTISSSCSASNPLLLKKTFLGFVRNKSTCKNTFAQKLLKSCDILSCEELIEVFEVANARESGNVIGGSY